CNKIGTLRTWRDVRPECANGVKADIDQVALTIREFLSTRLAAARPAERSGDQATQSDQGHVGSGPCRVHCLTSARNCSNSPRSSSIGPTFPSLMSGLTR